MATDNEDILLDDDGDDLVSGGDFVVADGKLDDCYIIFQLNKGALKGTPLMGPNLQLMINDSKPPTAIKQACDLSLQMDGKSAKSLEVVDGKIAFEI